MENKELKEETNAFVFDGAKWQAEKMYSEEQVKFIRTCIDFYWNNHNDEHLDNLKDFEISKSILEKK
jgi:hypothetical protein